MQEPPSKLVGYDNPKARTNRELLLLLNGLENQYVSFLKKDPSTGKMTPYAAILTDYFLHPETYLFPIDELLGADLDIDAYHSINTSYRRGHGYAKALRDKITDPITNKPFHIPARKTKDLSKLGALYVDCDCYNIGLSPAYVQYKITELVDAGKLPQPSYFKDSGAGLWAFWLLTETKAFNRSDFDQIPTYRRIQRTIVRTLKHLGADPNCTDATRITRNHGSLNSKTKTRVRMHVVHINGKIPRYDLAYLEDFFQCYPEYKLNPLDVESLHPYQPITAQQLKLKGPPRDVDEATRQKSQCKYRGRWKLQLTRFWALVEDVRGLIPDGQRHDHDYILGHFLKHLTRDDPDRTKTITAAATRLHRCFANPETHPLEESIATITAAAAQPLDGQFAKLTNQRIADRLRITKAEAETINEQIKRRRSEGWPSASDQEPATKPKTRKEQKRERIEYLKTIQRHLGKPSFQEIADDLTDRGLPCDKTMVCREWRSIHPPELSPLLPLDAAPPIEFSIKKPEPAKILTPDEFSVELAKALGSI